MFSIGLNRKAKSRWRALIICAMLPLTVLNGRTVMGCGCTGHFEAVCHCNCSGANCCGGKHGTPCPCCKSHSKNGASDSQETSDKGASVHGHRCKGIAQHEVIPATVVPTHVVDDIGVAAFSLDLIDVPTTLDICSLERQLTGHILPPPLDRVVTLHRLVI